MSAIAATDGYKAYLVCIWGEDAAYHNPLTWSVLVDKYMVGLLATKWVHICHSLAVSLEPLGDKG